MEPILTCPRCHTPGRLERGRRGSFLRCRHCGTATNPHPRATMRQKPDVETQPELALLALLDLGPVGLLVVPHPRLRLPDDCAPEMQPDGYTHLFLPSRGINLRVGEDRVIRASLTFQGEQHPVEIPSEAVCALVQGERVWSIPDRVPARLRAALGRQAAAKDRVASSGLRVIEGGHDED